MVWDIIKAIGTITGILGFIISLINLIYFFIIRKKKINIRLNRFGVCDHNNPKNVLKVNLCFENLSQLPVSITRVQVVIDKNYIDCEHIPMIIEEAVRTKSGKIYDQDYVKSTRPPINLSPLQAESVYFAFLIPRDTISNSDTQMNFQICTNRGKAVEKTLLLNETLKIR